MTQIGDLFAKDIHRNINGVIKVAQLGEAVKQQELEEYVITRETDRYFKQFFDSYLASLQAPSDNIGVWISCFFCSGKSHFLKILSYLLKNDTVAGRKALAYFKDKISDALLYAAMERSAEVQSDVILFNIDSKADAHSKTDKEAIVKVLMKVFNEHLGYFSGDLAIANFERQLDSKGKYQAFKSHFAAIHGSTWEQERDTWTFAQDSICATLQEITAMSEASARNLVDNVEGEYAFSVADFAGIIKDYLASKDPGHRLIFMIDEVGQYIGSNSDLMLNLQTVSEDLGSQCQGQAWIMVTSQEDIDSVTQGKVKAHDFSKIQGRYKNRISLTSANTDEVIRLRLLKKDEQHQASLEQCYEANTMVLANQIRFSDGSIELPGYQNASVFIASYPFVPYQFKLLQEVFTKVREMGATGKHLAAGERSMLEAFQLAAQALSAKSLGALAPFHSFFQAIEGFLDSPVRRVFDNAQDNSRLEAFDIDILKTLFMIRYVKGVAGNVENLSTFSIDRIGQDRLALETQVKAALARLERETLVQRVGNDYQFLTNEEQDVGRELKSSAYDPSPAEVVREVQKLLWEELYIEKEYRRDKRHSYPFNRKLDDVAHVRSTAAMDLNVISSYGDHHIDLSQDSNAMARTGGRAEVLVRLSNDAAIFSEITDYVRTNKYISEKNNPGITPSLRNILHARQEDNRNRRDRVRSLLETALEQADIFVSGDKLEQQSRTVKQVMEAGLASLIDNTYNKLSHVRSSFESHDNVASILSSNTSVQTLDANPANILAHDAMHSWLEERERLNERITLRKLLEKFQAVPYGWAELDIVGVLAELLTVGKVDLEHPHGVDLRKASLVKDMLSRNGQDNYSLRVPKAVPAATLKLARELAQEAFNSASIPHDAQELLALYQQELQQWRRNIEDLSKQAQATDPYVHHFESWQELLRTLLAETRVAAFFDSLQAKETAFEALLDTLPTVKNFFETQKRVFDDARRHYEQLEQNLQHIHDEAMQHKLQQAHSILTASDPSRDIPQLKELLNPVSDYVNAQRNAHIQEALEHQQAALSSMQSFADSLDSATLDTLLEPLRRLENTIKQASSIDAALASMHHIHQNSERVKESIIKAINDAINSQRKPLETAPDPEKGSQDPPQRQLIRLRLQQFAPEHKLSNSHELEAWLEQLRANLSQTLQDSDIYLE